MQSLPGTLHEQGGFLVQRVPGTAVIPITTGAPGLDGEALAMSAKVSHLQPLSQTVTNYNPFASGEEHLILQIFILEHPRQGKEFGLCQGLSMGARI